MREKVVVLVALLGLGGLAAHAQCRSGYSQTAGDTCTTDGAVHVAPVASPHTGHTIQRRVAGECSIVISWAIDGEPICEDSSFSPKAASPSLSLRPFLSGLGWLLGL